MAIRPLCSAEWIFFWKLNQFIHEADRDLTGQHVSRDAVLSQCDLVVWVLLSFLDYSSAFSALLFLPFAFFTSRVTSLNVAGIFLLLPLPQSHIPLFHLDSLLGPTPPLISLQASSIEFESNLSFHTGQGESQSPMEEETETEQRMGNQRRRMIGTSERVRRGGYMETKIIKA